MTKTEEKRLIEEAMEQKFITPMKFTLGVEEIVMEQSINYIDAIVQYCDRNNLEIESVPGLLTGPLKERIKTDAIRLNYIKEKNTSVPLPI